LAWAEEPPSLAPPVETAPPVTAPIGEPPPLAPVNPTADGSDAPTKLDVPSKPEEKSAVGSPPAGLPFNGLNAKGDTEGNRVKNDTPTGTAKEGTGISGPPALPFGKLNTKNADEQPASPPSGTAKEGNGVAGPPALPFGQLNSKGAEDKAEAAPAPRAQPETEVAAPAPSLSAPEPDRASAAPEYRTTTHYQARIPGYQLERPMWGFEVTGSASALGGTDVLTQSTTTQAVGIQIDYQPPFLQFLGVIDLGIQGGIFNNAALTETAFTWYYLGVQVRYQLKVFREQPIVPVAGFEYIWTHFNLNTGDVGSGIASGPFFGAWLLMNFFDEGDAAQMYVNNGISRTYVVAELHEQTLTSTQDSNVSASGQSLFFGLRFEF
jgi:hypothetical protein